MDKVKLPKLKNKVTKGANIKLDSRYKDVKTIYHSIDANSGYITSDGSFIRYILSEDKSSLIGLDFEGGPMLKVGDIMPEINKKIKILKHVFYVELE